MQSTDKRIKVQKSLLSTMPITKQADTKIELIKKKEKARKENLKQLHLYLFRNFVYFIKKIE